MQQINLYLPEFRPNREPVRAVHMLWGCLAFILLLVLYSFYSQHQYQQLQLRLKQEQQAQEGLKQQLNLLKAQKPAQASAQLDLQIQQLQKNLQRHQQILSMISNQNLGNDKGFSAQLTALGQASLSSISLESFSLQKNGSYAEMSGKTRAADQVPLYLQRLRNNPSFTHVAFGVLKIERDEKNTSLLQFSLAKPDDGKSKSGGKH